MRHLLLSALAAPAMIASANAGTADKVDVRTCEAVVGDAQDFIAAAPGYYSAETALALERCIAKISAKTTLGKRLRRLHEWLEAQPLGGE